MNDATAALRAEVKQWMLEELMLQVTEIGDDQPLFGPGGLGLDSVDALQLVVALEKRYGLKIPDAAAARAVLGTVRSIAETVAAHQAGRAVFGPDSGKMPGGGEKH